MAKKSWALSNTEIGKLSENTVVNALMVESKGRLLPCRPVADDGVDLLAYDKRTGASVPLQIKCRTNTRKRRPQLVHFNIGKLVAGRHVHGFMLAMLLKDDVETVECAWLIPMRDLPRIANRTSDTYALRPSINPKSNDKYKKYRCRTIKEVVARLEKMFDA